MLTDKADVGRLEQAAVYAKIRTGQLKPKQPWKFEDKTAELLQMTSEDQDSPIVNTRINWRGVAISLDRQQSKVQVI